MASVDDRRVVPDESRSSSPVPVVPASCTMNSYGGDTMLSPLLPIFLCVPALAFLVHPQEDTQAILQSDGEEARFTPPGLRPLKESTDGVLKHVKNVIKDVPPENRENVLLCILQAHEQRHQEELKAHEQRHQEELKKKDQKIEELIANNTNLKCENTKLNCEKATVTREAELAEFLLFTRDAIVVFEMQNSRGCPEKNDDFIKVVLTDYKNAKVNNSDDIPKMDKKDFQGKIHFQKWLWVLLFGNEKECMSLVKLRNALTYELRRYLWFSRQIEHLYTILCGDIHGKSPLEIRNLKKENFPIYANFFADDIRKAVLHFLENVYSSEELLKA